MITIAQVAGIFQFTYHLIAGPMLLLFAEKLFNYPIFYKFIHEDPDKFTPTKSDTEFLSILGGMFLFLGFIFLICFFTKNRKAMLVISAGQIMIYTQIRNILKPFRDVDYILSVTLVEFILGILTAILVITDFVMNYPREREEEKKRFDEKVAKVKKEYGIKDDDENDKDKDKNVKETKEDKKAKKNN
ncbi:hypothetical protein H8356DRAFT_466921 [Neocallimastix lanati (nom. inval.)]|jgi:hypothetical protein|uniref:Uncharacterized protein n=1 Tax=Neocallimastix californiae TaxID=1754190 RepID=A0A1Y2AVQ2_9FUNG|nr:hypothetical protein H8356DRAFT_466921 [Neocallimastix sp. JGI-2020a]ORY26566.1 hypothetical protein LY90DRAFT_674577 [Neocallimastix californiae]|eukprot:ORY26566.1 hypothetical protein LY90DRAFT_674577 [Neocallimastix californiae]